jgi:hypothetical protein
MAETAKFSLILASPAVTIMEKKIHKKQSKKDKGLIAILQYRTHVNGRKMTGRHEERKTKLCH